MSNTRLFPRRNNLAKVYIDFLDDENTIVCCVILNEEDFQIARSEIEHCRESIDCGRLSVECRHCTRELLQRLQLHDYIRVKDFYEKQHDMVRVYVCFKEISEITRQELFNYSLFYQ